MRTSVGVALASSVVAVGAWLVSSCLDPTEIEMRVTQREACGSISDALFLVDGVVQSMAPASGCQPRATGGTRGSVVLLPGAEKAPLLSVIARPGAAADPYACVTGDPGDCIVARRKLNFVTHRSLHVPVALTLACAGIECQPGTTCEQGVCVDENAFDPTACTSPSGCAPDAGAGDLLAGRCGDRGGLDTTSPWPMNGFCNTRSGMTDAKGPTLSPTMTLWLGVNGPSGSGCDPGIALRGATDLVASCYSQLNFYSLASPSGNPQTGSVLPDTSSWNRALGAVIAANGTAFAGFVASTASPDVLCAVTPPATAQWCVALPPAYLPAAGQDPVITGDGTVWVPEGDGKIHGFDPDTGAERPSIDLALTAGQSAVDVSPIAIRQDGRFVVTIDGLVIAASRDGAPPRKYTAPTPAFYSSPAIGPGNLTWVVEAPIDHVTSSHLVALDPSLTQRVVDVDLGYPGTAARPVLGPSDPNLPGGLRFALVRITDENTTSPPKDPLVAVDLSTMSPLLIESDPASDPVGRHVAPSQPVVDRDGTAYFAIVGSVCSWSIGGRTLCVGVSGAMTNGNPINANGRASSALANGTFLIGPYNGRGIYGFGP